MRSEQTPHRREFAEAVAEAVRELGGDRAVGKASGVNHSVWYDTKIGKSVPGDANWAKMHAFLSDSSVPRRDWDALRNAAQPSKRERATTRRSNAPPPRLHTAATNSMTTFALPPISRLHLVDRRLEDSGIAVPGRVCYLLGEGGLGKSVLLGQLAERLAEAEASPAVVVLACGRVGPGSDLSSETSVDRTFGRAVGDRGTDPSLRSLVRSLQLAYGSVFVLVDTLDLLLTGTAVAPIMSVLAEIADHAQLFVSCRAQEYLDLLADPIHRIAKLGDREAEAVDLPPLAPHEVVEWATAYVGGLDVPEDDRRRFLASLSDPAAARIVREVCAVPLRLALACNLYSEEGRLPTDLTITGLYESYWDRRICRDRSGHRSEFADAQESVALWLARKILAQSDIRLSLSVSGTVAGGPRRSSRAVVALLGEGLLRYESGRYEFFHQSFAEFAVARCLNSEGNRDELHMLTVALQGDPHSHFWPVARHLLLQKSSINRFNELRAAVPSTNEGVRYHLLAALIRRSPELLEEVAAPLARADRARFLALVKLLEDAPAECAAAALRLTVPALAEIDPDQIPGLARTIGVLLARAPSRARISYLEMTLDTAVLRKSETDTDTWLHVPANLIEAICREGIEPHEERLLCERYAQLGVRGHRLMIRACLAHPEPSRSGTRAAAVLSMDCPSDMSDDEVVAILAQFWNDPSVRADRGWTDWRALLSADLRARWSNAQIKLVSELACDPSVRDELLSAVIEADVPEPRGRWVNTAKLVADKFPDVVAARLMARHGEGDEVAALPTRRSTGVRATMSVQIAPHLAKPVREKLIARLAEWESVDPRAVWKARVVLAGADADLHEKLLAEFDEVDSHGRKDGAQVVGNSLDAWLNVSTPATFLADHAVVFRNMVVSKSKDRRNRTRAVLEGRIARLDSTARQWISGQLLSGPSPSVATAAVDAVGHECAATGPLTVDEISWLLGLLPTPHSIAAQRIAELLGNKRLATDETLRARADKGTTSAQDAVLDRLMLALERGENRDAGRELVRLSARLVSLEWTDIERVRRVVDGLSAEVLKIPELLAADRVGSKEVITAIFNLWADSIGTLAQRTLPLLEVDAVVRAALTGWDCSEVGKNIVDVVSKVILGRMGHSPEFVSWAKDELWPMTGPGTKEAIGLAFTVYERTRPTSMSLELAQRDDCPPKVAAIIRRRWRD